MKKAFLFDLDSTLLQMDSKKFMHLLFTDFKEIFTLEELEELNKGFITMVSNNGSRTNEEAFMSSTSKNVQDKIISYYASSKFVKLGSIVDKTDLSRKIIDYLKQKNYQIILATNPLFPKEAVYTRLEWAGLSKDDFSYITSIENCTYAKPSKDYYLEILRKNNLTSSEVVMVGNDLKDDFSQIHQQFDCCLITDYILNEDLNLDIKKYSYNEFYDYIIANY